MKKTILYAILVAGLVLGGYPLVRSTWLGSCMAYALGGFREITADRNNRFLGKVQEDTARCRGGTAAVAWRKTPWIDWQKYRGAGDETSRIGGGSSLLGFFSPDRRGINGALLDLEYQRVELLKFNLFDNAGTFEEYIAGRNGVEGATLRTWSQFRLPKSHPAYTTTGADGPQKCAEEWIRFRTLSGICNDISNPLMGSADQPFARNVEFKTTFPELGRDELVRNRHGDRVGLLQPDPQLISRKLFTRVQTPADTCNRGRGLPNDSLQANCDYQKAPHINVLAAFWIQFMTHDWFSHLEEGHNQSELIAMGCDAQPSDKRKKNVTQEQMKQLGCRPGDRIDKGLVAEDHPPASFSHGNKTYLARAHKTTLNKVTAWWDASQIYGYSETSQRRVNRDGRDRAKLRLDPYLPVLQRTDPMNPQWSGQESVAFPDNWNIGLSFFHNVFAREHNIFVDKFREWAKTAPEQDSGLRNPERPHQVIRYKDVSDEELFEVARLVIAAEIAKVHTVEWTTQLLYNEPVFLAMNANWSGLFDPHTLVTSALKTVIDGLAKSTNTDKTTQWYSVFATGPGIFGLGNDKPDVNGGINHFGSPFNFPEEFVTVYRLHPLVPDLIEFRRLRANPDIIQRKIPVVDTIRGKATTTMRQHGWPIGRFPWDASGPAS